jgi:hypothetical protein
MDARQADPVLETRQTALVGLGEDLRVGRRDRITPRPAAQPLRCVSSGYLSHGCRCVRSVPAEVAEAAWTRARAAGPDSDRFFQFAWEGAVWLAYGIGDDGVRGVYCPEHRAEREGRSLTEPVLRGALTRTRTGTA